jgi:hypothetical protein
VADPTPQAIVEAFLLRARRVQSHSLIREHPALMQKLHSGEVKLNITRNTKTGESTHRVRIEYPPEEAMESLAGRVRPLILRGEPIYYDKVFDALEELVGSERLDEEIDLAWWRNYWHEAADANLDAQAYWVATPGGKVTDRKLMYAWLYGDVVHAKSPRSPVIRDLGIDERYYAAAPVIARICDRVLYTKFMLDLLRDKGLFAVDPAVLEDEVVVPQTTVDREVRMYTAEVGAPLPDDLGRPEAFDADVWQSVDALFEDGEADPGAEDDA